MPKVMIQIDDQVIEADSEQAAYLAEWKSDIAADRAAREAEAIARQTAKEAVLAKLGLTAEEAAALIG